jgi:hypothetical protein
VQPQVSQKISPEPSPLLVLVCASVVAKHDPTWLARPVAANAATLGVRPERVSRLKAQLRGPFAEALAVATRRGRPAKAPPTTAETPRASRAAALLLVATALLARSRVPVRRREVQDELVCAFDRVHADYGATQAEFCAALSLSERTFRSWRARPPAPAVPPPRPPPPAPPKNDRRTGRFDLDVTAPGTQLGGDTTDLRVLGVELKLVGTQDLGAREQRLFEAFALDERENSDLVVRVLTDALAGRDGLQFITDQGTPYVSQAAKLAYEALGVDHAPQKEGTPTDKATVERAWDTVQRALAPLLDLSDRVAQALPALRRADLARAFGTLLVAVFLRVYAAGRRHLAHPLAGEDPALLRAVIEEQRDHARAEGRSRRLFLEGVHAEYAMRVPPRPSSARSSATRSTTSKTPSDGSAQTACRCRVRLCDRYFAAVVRDAHQRGTQRRAAAWYGSKERAQARRAQSAAARRAADLDAHPEHRLHEGLDLLAETWLPQQRRFRADAALARSWLRRAVADLHHQAHYTDAAADTVEAHVRAWFAAHPALDATVCDRVRQVLAQVSTDVAGKLPCPHSPLSVGDILPSSARARPDNPRPPPPPHLRIQAAGSRGSRQ